MEPTSSFRPSETVSAASQEIRDRMAEARQVAADIDTRVKVFAREYPIGALLAALATGWFLGRLVSRW
ncbi:MAG: hypothetical protein AB1640_09905 [bacterium]